MISFQADKVSHLVSFKQTIDDLARLRSAVDIISNQNLSVISRWMLSEIPVDLGKHLIEQIEAAMDVANCVDPRPIGGACVA